MAIKKKTVCWHCHKPIKNEDNIYNLICPNCKSNFADKPKNEAILHLYQQEYLQTRNKEVFGKMLLGIQNIAYNQICSKLKATGKFLTEEELEDKVSWTVLKMVKKYSDPDFMITSSFIDYLNDVVLYPLYNYKLKNKEQNEISLYTPIKGTSSNNKKENTLYDIMKESPILEENGEVENYFFKEIEKENVVILVNDFIETIISSIYKKKDFVYSLKIITLLDYYIKQDKNNKLFVNWWNVEGLEFKNTFEKILVLFRNSLRE